MLGLHMPMKFREVPLAARTHSIFGAVAYAGDDAALRGHATFKMIPLIRKFRASRFDLLAIVLFLRKLRPEAICFGRAGIG